MLKYPETKVEEVKENFHGIEIIDPYRWLENGNDPEVQRWVEEQNNFFRAYIDKISVRDRLKNLFQELFNVGYVSPFIPRRGRYFFEKRIAGQNHSVLYYRDGLNGEDKIVIDPNKFSEDGTKALAGYVLSRDGKLAIVAITQSGSDRLDVNVLDIDNNRWLDSIPSIRYPSFMWLSDGSGFYYTKWPEPGVEKEEKDLYRVYFHKLGTKHEDDIPIFGRDIPPEKRTSIYLSPDDKYLLISVGEGRNRNDLYYKDLKKDSEIKPLIIGKDALFDAVVRGNKVFVRTNYKAPRFRLVSFDIRNPDENKWREIVPETKDTLVSFSVIGNKIVVEYLSNATSSMKLYTKSGKFLKDIEFPELGTVYGPYAEPDGKEMFLEFSSFIRPPTIYRYDLSKKKLQKLHQTKLNMNLDNLKLYQVWYESKDKTKVSMFIVHRKDIKLDGNNPTVLYGYGGFNISITSVFNKSILPFLQDGGVYAVANLRGGGEYGEEWHRAGIREKKQNVFDDFIAAAEWLINNKYTNKERLVINGGSNGGLLVGACITQRPNLYKAAVCEAGVLDMLRYHKFDGGALWIPEYGCADNKEDFNYLIKYSPYHNVRKGEKYPAVLFMTGDNDTRVNPLHSRKMVAKMQACNSSDNPILLRTERKAGHGFGKPISKLVEELADKWAFIYHQLGMDNKNNKLKTL